MAPHLDLVPPGIVPPLDDGFRPAVLANRHFRDQAKPVAIPLAIGLERGSGEFSRYDTVVFPEDHSQAAANLPYVERLVKFLLWQRGGFRIHIGGPESIAAHIRYCFGPQGPRSFDHDFMGEQVYERPLEVLSCEAREVPASSESWKSLGGHLNGCRIGFDLGASDRKVSAVVDGRVVFSEEVVWEPGRQSDPEYHYREVMAALRAAAGKMPRVDAIGGSAAGIYIDNRPMVASLFRSIPRERYGEIRNLFRRIQDDIGAPIEIINDGDVTALAGSMSLADNGVLGIAMGSSEAAGYVDPNGHITGWLNELAFAPIDYSPTAPVDEWSGDTGCGASYFSQQCVFRLAPRAGIEIPSSLPDAGRLKFVQQRLEAGDANAGRIWQSIGVYLGYGIAQYAGFYEIKHVLILGRCTSGRGGEVIAEEAQRVLESEFPDLAHRIHIHLPDENSRRVGQSIAAASLPVIQDAAAEPGRMLET